MFGLVRVLFASALFIVSMTPSSALAQSTGDPWAEPLNLSHSGIAENPAFVIDSDGVGHAVWQDDLGYYVYTRLDGNQWSLPETTSLNLLFGPSLPGETRDTQSAIYTGPNPSFIAGPGQFIYAFWISPEGELLTSKVRNPDFEHVTAWQPGRPITAQAASFSVAGDARGVLHLAYVRTVSDAASPAGIYYTRSSDSGVNWSSPVLLYESSYLRRLGEGEANVSLAIAGPEDAQRVYVAWDNRPRKQAFLAQSADGGRSWEQPKLVAGPEPDSGSAGPFNIQVGADQNSLVLVWQSGQPGGACSQIYQSSRDSGATWSQPQLMIEGLLGCAQANEFVTGLAGSSEAPLYFLTETKGQVSLSAWNGLEWSQPQAQPTLSGFEEPEIYTGVDYGCHRASLLAERLYIIGCDQGGGGDVWVTSLDLRSNTSWFSAPVWSQLSPIVSESLEIEAVELAATDDGSMHAFITQHQAPAIYYTYWDGELWSRITPVLELPAGEAAGAAVAAGPGNELFLIAPDNRGTLYFSRATSGNAATESRWSTPTQFETGHEGQIGSADVAWDAAGTVYVAYSVPVNEDRGVYLVQSKDHGASWSKPLQVFDGEAAGFDLVGAPSLLTSANGVVHVIWKEQSIEGDGVPQPLALYHARSDDGGQTFSDAALAVEEPVGWREILADGNGNLHLLWQSQDTPTTVWDQVSVDGGRTWEHPHGLPDEGKVAAVTSDPAGRLHLVGVGLDALGNWLWDGSRWQSEAPLALPWSSQQESLVRLLAATVNPQGKMMVVLAESTGEGDSVEMRPLYSTRALELPPEQPGIQEVPTQTLLPPPTFLSTPATAVDSGPANSGDQTNRNEANGLVSPLLIALLPVALLLLVVLGIVMWRVARSRDR
jgi:hypothetical protein